MRVIGKNIPGIELTLTKDEAFELSHCLSMYQVSLRQGGEGRGTSIEDRIKFIDDLTVLINNRVGGS